MDRRREVEAVIIVFAVMLPTIAAVETYCTVRTTGMSGQLICQFSTNISEEQNDFLVQRYNLDVTNQDPEQVVNCHWIKPTSPNLASSPLCLDCHVAPGYVFDEKVWNMLIIDIPTLSQKHEGQYMCQVLGDDNGENEDNTCEYKYKGGQAATLPNTTPAITSTVQNGGQAATPPNTTPAITSTVQNGEISLLVSILIIVAVNLVLGVVAAVYIFRGKLYAKHDTAQDRCRSDDKSAEETKLISDAKPSSETHEDFTRREGAGHANTESAYDDEADVDLRTGRNERDPLTCVVTVR